MWGRPIVFRYLWQKVKVSVWKRSRSYYLLVSRNCGNQPLVFFICLLSLLFFLRKVVSISVRETVNEGGNNYLYLPWAGYLSLRQVSILFGCFTFFTAFIRTVKQCHTVKPLKLLSDVEIVKLKWNLGLSFLSDLRKTFDTRVLP